jgi:hypothetical protein
MISRTRNTYTTLHLLTSGLVDGAIFCTIYKLQAPDSDHIDPDYSLHLKLVRQIAVADDTVQ